MGTDRPGPIGEKPLAAVGVTTALFAKRFFGLDACARRGGLYRKRLGVVHRMYASGAGATLCDEPDFEYIPLDGDTRPAARPSITTGCMATSTTAALQHHWADPETWDPFSRRMFRYEERATPALPNRLEFTITPDTPEFLI